MLRLGFYLRREWLSLSLAVIAAALVLGCLYGPFGPRDLVALRERREELTALRNHKVAENAKLKARIARLGSDELYLQRLIRSDLGYARPDEFVYRFPDHREQSTR